MKKIWQKGLKKCRQKIEDWKKTMKPEKNDKKWIKKEKEDRKDDTG